LIGVETGIKTIPAVHSQCRLWVISGQTSAGQNPPLFAVTPKAAKRGCGCDVRYVPILLQKDFSHPDAQH
jgi:hypothetical protein